ncbi:DNA-processing protein DprA [Paenibacillus sp. M1]|uniref:DNA-processing protein DprA n=1 Tax=Paenibacillus haidiansis TaxID=1574488 RepID=A0ABU7VN89_9BACL
MDKRSILIGLHESPGIGWKKIAGILSGNDDWEHAPDFSPADWMERGLESELALRMSQGFTPSWIEARMELMDRKGIRPITVYDPSYPILMKETGRPPWVLYTIGDTKLLASLSIAMIGTRVPTAYGRKVATWLTEGLCAQGVAIVSGLARGIDGICHQAALNAGGLTIAVLGTAIDVAYPREHAGLYRQIAERGLILSEYPVGTQGRPGMFPQRNRIIAGLSRGTVVVEADVRSGSLITADQALEEGRDVFAVPGPITSPKSRGTLGLIKQGAKLVMEPGDILEEYGPWLKGVSRETPPVADVNELTIEERRIYHMLEQGNTSFEGLMEESGWDFGLLHSVLLSLIMKKAVVQLPGFVYKII